MENRSTEAFLKKYALCADCYDLAAEIGKFRGEMLCGLDGEESSLWMIPTFLSSDVPPFPDRKVIVLDAGGTNLRVGAVAFTKGRVSDVQFRKYPLPGTDRTLTKDEFFDAVAEKLAPYLDESDSIGFCFSYVAKCTEDKDAELVAFCKEVKVTGAEGAHICRELDAAIRRRGVTKKYRYVQLNDTVATHLGGMAACDRTQYDGFIGFILGTGTNGCYTEQTEAIHKYTGSVYREKNMIVNMESGCYAGFTGGELDALVDAASAIPGDHPAEKMISGAYLGKILALALRRAAEEGLLTAKLPETLTEIPMPDVNAFLAEEKSVLDTLIPESDRAAVREIILGLYGRTARLMAVVFASVALHTGCGRTKPMGIVIEGSTYQKSPFLQKALARELRALKIFYGCDFVILGAENATLTGAAFAALSNR